MQLEQHSADDYKQDGGDSGRPHSRGGAQSTTPSTRFSRRKDSMM